MEEARRQAYLRAMGVQVYFPRITLAGAKASPKYNLSSETDRSDVLLESPAPMPGAPTSPVQSTASSVPSSRQELPRFRSKNPDKPIIDTSTKGRARAASVGAAPAPADGLPSRDAVAGGELGSGRSNEAGPVTTSLRFDLGYFVAAEDVAILYEIPPVAREEDKARAKKLLSAILLACELNPAAGSASPVHEAFNWPLENDLGLSSSDQAAAAALAGFIRRRHDGDRFKELIVFGGVVEPLIAEIGKSMPYRQTLLASLSAMLSLASLKREVWADLQPVIARIRV